jgi:hypothetical protein
LGCWGFTDCRASATRQRDQRAGEGAMPRDGSAMTRLSARVAGRRTRRDAVNRAGAWMRKVIGPGELHERSCHHAAVRIVVERTSATKPCAVQMIGTLRGEVETIVMRGRGAGEHMRRVTEGDPAIRNVLWWWWRTNQLRIVCCPPSRG